ncbi:hypothetical protein [Acinetobacter sp. YH12069]|uniref:hypothetical protein n=1 Tax=Acinetobacter sp. YH12069 TaxID=2601065 RepID=UPI0015D31D33|nr:hypothetical protein [Acinetobacter sp. YH12069]
MDIHKEREAFEKHASKFFTDSKEAFKTNGDQYLYDEVIWMWDCWIERAKANTVPEVAQRQGGYYIRDLRSQPGNCMKFWYQAGYGTKHKNFFWCATLEEAKEYKDGCDWFEIWHAPYIDSLVEYTVDFQLADRGVGLVDLKAQEPAND